MTRLTTLCATAGLLVTLATTACLLVAPKAAAAEPSLPARLPASEAAATVPDAELDRLRGGFLVAGNVVFDFGATTRTFVDGELALQTELTWSPTGTQVTQTGGAGAMLSPAALSALSAAGIRPNLGSAAAAVSADGTTFALQNLTATGLTNLLVSTGDGHTLSQNTDVTLTLPGFQAVQSQLSTVAMAARLAQSVATTALSAGGR